MKNYRSLVYSTLALIMTFPALCNPLEVQNRQELHGRIVRVTDGDTVLLIDDDNNQIKIRLASIDAPESKMSYGLAARTYLADLVLDKEVIAITRKTDRYGRTIATLMQGAKDVNLAMVKAGMAWHYKEYAREQSETQSVAYSIAEIDARIQRIGLWQQEKSMAPWDWRHSRREILKDLGVPKPFIFHDIKVQKDQK